MNLLDPFPIPIIAIPWLYRPAPPPPPYDTSHDDVMITFCQHKQLTLIPRQLIVVAIDIID